MQKPEFQGKITTTQYRYNLGKYLHALEERRKVPHGLLATAYAYGVPAFCPSPGDGSTFLNAMKLWTMQNRLGQDLKFNLEIDVPKDIYESCALHYWAQHQEGNKEFIQPSMFKETQKPISMEMPPVPRPISPQKRGFLPSLLKKREERQINSKKILRLPF